MTETDTVEVREDTAVEIVDLLETGLSGRQFPDAEITRNRALAVKDNILGQLQDEQRAVGFCGLPGAGKSYAAEVFAGMIGGERISMGDAIRREFARREFEIDPDEWDGFAADSGELGDFAAEARDEDPKQIPRWVTDLAEERDAELYAIDGVRSVTDYEVLSDYFEDFVLVEITAPFYERYDRITERGREGEDDFTPNDLLDRDQHEFDELGFRGLKEVELGWDPEDYLPNMAYTTYDLGLIDVTISNDATPAMFDQSLQEVAETIKWISM